MLSNWNVTSAENEARSICDERGITNFDDFQKIAASIRHQRFMRSIEPYIAQKIRIHNTRMVSHILIGEDGQLGETVYKPLPLELEQGLSSLDELIAAEAKRWGFDPPTDSKGG
jgi:hypothetical protein